MTDYAVNWIPVSAAAEKLGVTRQRVAQLCLSGKLLSETVGWTRLVNLRSIEEFADLREKGRVGRGACR